MVQDFAKIRPEPVLEKRPSAAPPAWSLLFTGMLTGLAIGVFACVLFYLSGNVPPLQPGPRTVQSTTPADSTGETRTEAPQVTPASDDLELEFYDALPDYEVVVNAAPVEIDSDDVVAAAEDSDQARYMLQIGAFERRTNADSLRARIEALQLAAVVKEEPRTGRTLFLVQSGPFSNRNQMLQAERILNASNIPNTRISLTLPQ